MDQTVSLLLFLVIIIVVIISVLALTNRIIFKMAVRNFTRRKAQSAIVIAGLMIGTAIISSALVVSDTMTNTFEVDVYRSLGEVDEEIWGIETWTTTTFYRYFSESIFDSMSANLSTVPEIEAVAPVISDTGAVFDMDTQLGEPAAALLGLDSQILRTTSFGDLDGHGFYPDALSEGEVAINSRLAKEMEASVGDTISLSYGAKDPANPLGTSFMKENFTVAKIIQEKDLNGKANYNQRKTIFFELDTLQDLLNRPNEINIIWISNRGDYRSGASYTSKVNKTIEEELDLAVGMDGASELNLEVHEVKAENLESAREGGESLGTLFMIFGMFSIIAGIVLIINIFVMLGEERKSEMGMARAVGMKGKHLVRMYIFEGSLYAFVAAIVGAFLGLLFGWILIQAFEFIFGSVEEFGEGSFNIPFYFTWTSIFIAFCLGLFITFITIIFASTRISKLNIIRAIRRIPEPKPERAKRRMIIAGVILIGLGFLFINFSFDSLLGGYYLAGVPMVILGLSLIAHKWASIRAVMTVAGIAILVFMYSPYDLPFTSEWDFSGLDSFVLSGVFSVLAAVIVVMFNSPVLLVVLQKIFGRGKSTRAVLKTAISYPMDSKFKTGMTLGMFALIIFTVTVIAMIGAMLAAQSDIILEQQSGGYDIIGITNPRTPFENMTQDTLPSGLRGKVDQLETISQATVTLVDYDEKKAQAAAFGPPTDEGKLEQYQLLGADDSFLSNNGFTLQDRDERYDTDAEAWEALNENGSYCIVDGTRLAYSGVSVGGPPQDMGGVYIGSKITIPDRSGQNRTRELTVIGIMDQNFFFNGIIVKKDIVNNEYGGVDSMFVVKLKSGEDADSVAKEFEKQYLELGLQTFDMIGIINTILSLTKNIMYLMEGFLSIGLLVGIAGIGIISYRNVVERRQQIGMLRAIGFKKSMVTKSFLIETSFITILAILIGLALGIGIGWQIYGDSGYEEQGVGFVIPWGNLVTISVIAYVATLIFTFYPALKAAKVPPAEALRYIE